MRTPLALSLGVPGGDAQVDKPARYRNSLQTARDEAGSPGTGNRGTISQIGYPFKGLKVRQRSGGPGGHYKRPASIEAGR